MRAVSHFASPAVKPPPCCHRLKFLAANGNRRYRRDASAFPSLSLLYPTLLGIKCAISRSRWHGGGFRAIVVLDTLLTWLSLNAQQSLCSSIGCRFCKSSVVHVYQLYQITNDRAAHAYADRPLMQPEFSSSLALGINKAVRAVSRILRANGQPVQQTRRSGQLAFHRDIQRVRHRHSKAFGLVSLKRGARAEVVHAMTRFNSRSPIGKLPR